MADATDYAEGGLSCRGRLERGALLPTGLFPLPGAKPHSPFRALTDGQSAYEQDAVGLEIAGVRLTGGAALGHSLADGRLRIELDRPRAAGGPGAVGGEFAGRPPRRPPL